MFTLFSFFIGIVVMFLGFLLVSQTQWFLQNFGDVGMAFGAVGMPWLSWKLMGVIFIFAGFIIAFNLFGAIFGGILNRLFTLGR